MFKISIFLLFSIVPSDGIAKIHEFKYVRGLIPTMHGVNVQFSQNLLSMGCKGRQSNKNEPSSFLKSIISFECNNLNVYFIMFARFYMKCYTD